MNFNKTEIDGVIVIEPKVVMDDRGYFMEEFRQNVFDQEIGHIIFDTEYELEATQGPASIPLSGNTTLMRCVIGKALVTVSDERPDSATRGQQLTIELSDSNHLLCFIPSDLSYSLSILSPKALLKLRCEKE